MRRAGRRGKDKEEFFVKKFGTRVAALGLCLAIGATVSVGAFADVIANPSTHNVTVNGDASAATGYNIDGNNYYKLRDLAAELDLGVTWDAATSTVGIDKDGHYKVDDTTLMVGNWAPATRARIQAVIDANANQGKYVCFDFDNTSVIFDVEEALLIYQIENLRFNITPEQLPDVLATQIPDMDQSVGTSVDGVNVTCNTLSADIVSDYTWLYENYAGFGVGDKDLSYIHASNQYQDFAAKLRYMYSAVGDTFDSSVSYPWVTYLFTGMTPDEVYALATESHQYWASYGRYASETWTSPIELTGESGIITISFVTGVTFTDELVDLYQTLMANGIDVYIISASFIDVIRAANDCMGYNVPEDHVFAMRNVLTEDGVYTNAYDYDWGGEGMCAQTQGAGKSTTITNFIAPNYDGAGPLMVFGDSSGDWNMMTDWMESGDTQLGVIFNRYRKTSDPIWQGSNEAAESIGDADARFVLQGRDENTGELRPSEYSIMMGSDTEVLVRPAS
jgi:hypothetical protein